ncbi:hypothetical protein M378DRAFT_78141 [Amanita muscaria Koide BX008]|uniref:ASTRA-associated protein 1 n=1 Tax=Amanita muscaria (strain Koide BX008) TaxID=946122 RepID=A0A0C2X710_AMAMK|nr:hypothetical protein M378DRAFT_78141 [Amanita muscaria Koide BX008]
MASSLPPPSGPTHTLRTHSSPVNALYVTDDNERIYSGDSSGVIVVTSTRTLRPIAKWNAHKDGVLGVEEWDQFIVTHARDNKLHVWDRIEEPPPSMRIGSGTAALVDLPTPKLKYSMDVNALNFCRFSLLRLPCESEPAQQALIALPNLVDSSSADIWTLHGCDRVHAAIGQGLNKTDIQSPATEFKVGIIMSLHLYLVTSEVKREASLPTTELRLLCTYENGSIVLWKYTREDHLKSVEGQGWDMIWTSKLHAESIMAMRVSRNNDFALTVSVDHIVGRYDLKEESADVDETCKKHRTKHPGNGCIAIRDDGKVCAIGGWDGKICLYSTKSFKPLGTLRHHKVGCQAMEFCHLRRLSGNNSGTGADEDEDDEQAQEKRSRWLVCGAKDHRVTIWELVDFERKAKTSEDK